MEKIFVNGLLSKEVPATAPDFILGQLSLNVDSFQKWLDGNSHLANNGWINLTVKKSKEGKRYIEVDTWKPNKEAVKVVGADDITEEFNIPEIEIPSLQDDDGRVQDLSTVPF